MSERYPGLKPGFFLMYLYSSNCRFMKLVCLALSAALLFSCQNNSSGKNGDKGDQHINYSPMKIEQINLSQLPAAIKFSGQLQEAWQWNDKEGKHIFVASYLKSYPDSSVVDSEEGQTYSAFLFVSEYIERNGAFALSWNETDSVRSCPFDITCSFIKDATTVTDLDSNGIAEVKYEYKTACRSDVSPAEATLVMHEDSSRYVLQGLLWVKLNDTDRFMVTENNADLETLPGYQKTGEEYMKTFGRYRSESSFAKANPSFIVYARKEWIKFATESFE